MDIKIEKKPPLVRYKYMIAGGVFLFVFIIYLLFSSMGPSKLRYNKENVQIVEVKRGKFIEYLDVESIAKPKITINLNSIENGTVERIVAEEGSMLSIGDTILILYNQDLLRSIEDV